MSALVWVDGEEFSSDECNGSDECPVEVHVHGCYADFGNCDEPTGHGQVAQ